MLNKCGVGFLVVDEAIPGSSGDIGASDATALDSCGETGTREPGSHTVSGRHANGIVFVLVEDTNAPGTVGIVGHDSKVGVMGSSKLPG